MLSLLLAVTGAVLLGAGVRGFVARSRRHRLAEPGRTGRRRLALAATGAGGLLLLAPDLLAYAVSGSPVVTDALGALGMTAYRLLVLVLLAPVLLTLVLAGDPVRNGARRLAEGARSLVPTAPGRSARLLRRGRHVPQEWAALVERERELAAWFLHHQRVVDTAMPALSDLTEPATRAAAEAMLACDHVRSDGPPPGTRDVLATDYGRAVGRFESALAAAESHARDTSPGSRSATATLAIPG